MYLSHVLSLMLFFFEELHHFLRLQKQFHLQFWFWNRGEECLKEIIFIAIMTSVSFGEFLGLTRSSCFSFLTFGWTYRFVKCQRFGSFLKVAHNRVLGLWILSGQVIEGEEQNSLISIIHFVFIIVTFNFHKVLN